MKHFWLHYLNLNQNPHAPGLIVDEKKDTNVCMPTTLHLLLHTIQQCLLEDFVWAKACSWTYVSSYRNTILTGFKGLLVFIDRSCDDFSLHWFFTWKDACGVLGLSTIQKVAACIRQLGYGHAANFTDEYIQIGEPTTIATLKEFCLDIQATFQSEFLCPPDKDQRAVAMAEYE